ncbi:hypothetical protein PF003_g12223 [Phytophthora fragariae]|nr:hypothetical protein PF003_g12223 [Phytophthora fragariae]
MHLGPEGKRRGVTDASAGGAVRDQDPGRGFTVGADGARAAQPVHCLVR